jgi:hypothetical protein
MASIVRAHVRRRLQISLLLAAACAGDRSTTAPADPDAVPADVDAQSAQPAKPTLLSLQTPDGSGQTVHPDFVATPSWFGVANQYLFLTPYPGGNSSFENPSVFTRSGAVTWRAPAGVQNPLVVPATGYLSDPDALFNPERNELWVYYRAVDDQNVIRLLKSADGVHFSQPETVVTGANHTIVSPTIVRRNAGDWSMWAVNANVGCESTTTAVEVRRSSDGMAWSEPARVNLAQPGYSVWHLDVQWIPSRGEYWAVYNVKTAGSCTTPALFLATSADGVTWTTYASPVLARGVIRAFADVVYRSTFSYDAASDSIQLWYSGARYDSRQYVWRSAYQQRSRSELFAAIAKLPNGALASLAPRKWLPPLLDAP